MSFNADDLKVINEFPHCDLRILHSPSKCEFCDDRREWQELRMAWGINFTGEDDEDKLPCPSSARDIKIMEKWLGNVPYKEGEYKPTSGEAEKTDA